MKRKIKNIILSVPGFENLCRILTKNHVRTLMYHRFSTDAVPGKIDQNILKEQMEYVLRYHTFLTPEDHLHALHDQSEPFFCPVVITVDDGYLDFYMVAFPVLQKLGIPAMVFLTSGFVDGKLLLWWDRLEQMIEDAAGRTVEVTLDGVCLNLDLTSKKSRKCAWHMLADRCRFLPHEEKEELIESLSEALNSGSVNLTDGLYAPLSWDQIRKMHSFGIQFGAHTLSHPILSRQPSELAKLEIEQSRMRLEKMLGTSVEWFCYPQGGPADYSIETKSMVKSAGFKGAYVAHQDISLEEDVFALPRYCPSADMKEFRWSLCGAEYLVLKLRHCLGIPAKPSLAYWAGSRGFEQSKNICEEN